MTEKKVKRTREKQIKFFVNDKEFNQIDQKAEKAKMNKSDYLRACALGKEIVVVDGMKELALEISRLGNNINQIAKAVHTGNIKDTGNLEKYDNTYQEVMNEILRVSRLIK